MFLGNKTESVQFREEIVTKFEFFKGLFGNITKIQYNMSQVM